MSNEIKDIKLKQVVGGLNIGPVPETEGGNVLEMDVNTVDSPAPIDVEQYSNWEVLPTP